MNSGSDFDGGNMGEEPTATQQALATPPLPPTQYVTRDFFLSAETARIRYKDVSVPGLGTVKVKSLNDREYSKLQAATMKTDGKMNIIATMASDAALIAACTLNGDNTPMFTENDVSAIRDRDAGIVANLAGAIRDHIGLPDPSAEKK